MSQQISGYSPLPGDSILSSLDDKTEESVPLEEPVYFDSKGRDYFAGVDQSYEGYIWRRDGKAVPVSYMHKTFADYFNALDAADSKHSPKSLWLWTVRFSKVPCVIHCRYSFA